VGSRPRPGVRDDRPEPRRGVLPDAQPGLGTRHGEGRAAPGRRASPGDPEVGRLRGPRLSRDPALRVGGPAAMTLRFVDLSHEIVDGMTTHPGIAPPVITTVLSFDHSRARYADGTEFEIRRIDMVANTGTYLDTP